MQKQDSLAYRVKTRRIKLGLSQEVLGLRADVSTSVIAKVEMGRSKMPRCIIELAKALGVSPGWLLFNENSPSEGLSEEARLLA